MSLRSLLSLSLRALLALAAISLGAGAGTAAPEAWKIDKGHSAILWKIKHLGLSFTHGRFNDFSGSLVIDDENLANAKVEIDIAAASLDSNDEGRDKHLRNEDFFDVENHPSISFASTSVSKTKENEYRVTGSLTLLGKSNEVTFRIERLGTGKDPWGNERIGFEGHLMIKRSEYGMDKMLEGIGDEVYITLAIEAIKHKPAPDTK